MKQPLHTTVERWAIALPNNAYLKDKNSDTGYCMFDTRADAKDIFDELGIEGQVIKVRITICPARP